jgi:hypothetical protein
VLLPIRDGLYLIRKKWNMPSWKAQNNARC